MINLTGKRVYLACGPTDMRAGINRLSAVVESSFKLDLYDGVLFVFCNRKRDLIRAIEWDGDGFWLHTKRLERGRFRWPAEGHEATMTLSGEELSYLIGGTRLELKLKRASVTEKKVV